MSTKLIIFVALVYSAAAAPAAKSRFNFDFSDILGTPAPGQSAGTTNIQVGVGSTAVAATEASPAEVGGNEGLGAILNPWSIAYKTPNVGAQPLSLSQPHSTGPLHDHVAAMSMGHYIRPRRKLVSQTPRIVANRFDSDELA